MNLTDAQRRIRLEFAATLRVLGRFGLEVGSAGHLTVADPEADDRFWSNPFGVPFADTLPEDIVLVDPAGAVVFGDHACNAAWTQTPVYPLRPDIRAMVHVHGPHTMAFSNLGRRFRALTNDSAEIAHLQLVQPGAGYDLASGFGGGSAKIVLSRYHGSATAGETLAEAAFYTVAVERAARTELMLAGVPGVEEMRADLVARLAIRKELADGDFRQEIEREIRVSGLDR